MKLQGLICALLDFNIFLAQLFFSRIPILLLRNGNVTVCHCMLERCNMSFYFSEAQGQYFSTNISFVSKLGPLNSAGTVSTMETLNSIQSIFGHYPIVSRGRIF